MVYTVDLEFETSMNLKEKKRKTPEACKHMARKADSWAQVPGLKAAPPVSA